MGSSVAGLAAADALRALGFDGSVILLGAERRTPYDRPPLTKAVLAGRQTPAECALRAEGWAADLDLDLRLGTTATGLDLGRRTVEVDSGPPVAFDRLVVATGSTPRTLALGGRRLEGVFTLRTMDEALAIRSAIGAGAKVVVVGGGFIGAEVAATARRLGAEVTILEADQAPLARALGSQIGSLLARIHADEGIAVRCGVPVADLEGETRIERVRLADSAAIDADVVIVGLGARPATEWLEGSGLEIRDGVVCDAFCRASAPGVVAAGDAARWEHPRLGSIRIEHWENAVTQGRAAANALLEARPAGPYDPVPYVWSDQYDYKLQLVGLPGLGDDLLVIDGQFDERRFLALYTRDGRVTAAVAIGRPRAIMRVRRLLRADVSVSSVIETLAETPKNLPNDGLTAVSPFAKISSRRNP